MDMIAKTFFITNELHVYSAHFLRQEKMLRDHVDYLT